MKNVVVTGAGRGIGLALTKIFASNGNRVLATYRDSKSAAGLLELAKINANVQTVVTDVTNENEFGAFKEALKKLGTVDILVNNAGVIGDKARSLMELDLEAVEDVFQVNTLGPMRTTRAVIPHMKAGATIGSITSLMGSIADNASGGYYDYRMSKAALNMFNSCLSKEFAQFTCLVLHPGWVATDMGGEGAPVTPDQSAQGLYKILTTSKASGSFFDFSGKELPW